MHYLTETEVIKYFFIACILIGICVFLVAMFEIRDERIKERERIKKIENIQMIFSELGVGDLFSDVSLKFKECLETLKPELISESSLEQGMKNREYIWYLDDVYLVGVSERLKKKYNYLEKAYIKLSFSNDKLVSKEQKGIYHLGVVS